MINPDALAQLADTIRVSQACAAIETHESYLIWIDQPRAKGFGDAVLRAGSLLGDEPFLVHAGDTFIISETGIFDRLCNAHLEKNV